MCGVLLALQFPFIMSSPLAALTFAIITTGIVGAIAVVVGGQLAPLPLYALILVSVLELLDFLCFKYNVTLEGSLVGISRF